MIGMTRSSEQSDGIWMRGWGDVEAAPGLPLLGH